MNSTYSIEVERPRADVFDFLTDDDNLPAVVPNLADHGVIEEQPGKIGSTFWHEYEEKGRRMRMTGVVTEYEAPRRWAVKLDGAFFGLEVAYMAGRRELAADLAQYQELGVPVTTLQAWKLHEHHFLSPSESAREAALGLPWEV